MECCPVGQVLSAELFRPLERVSRAPVGRSPLRVERTVFRPSWRRDNFLRVRCWYHDEDPFVGGKRLHQYVKATRESILAVAHRFQMLGSRFGILRKGLVYRIAIDAVDVRAAMAEVLGEDTGDQSFSVTPLPFACAE